ncbi:hypothetical protein GCM10025867_47410 (plasmid) [Frondihabitans sucicola]|uniref:Uncharacterized protein n=1 Tax=Frondihabitans sucicola TaxID=1268041 RepID=A0ABN6Y997_9MICO|nr:hypothetical protein [Frondihabitans sucicola]BDZ52500.1 hypothetical protein GCM10025867_47410 [Frondihabitans sucicola]
MAKAKSGTTSKKKGIILVGLIVVLGVVAFLSFSGTLNLFPVG